jgi:hypothetical protein
MTEKNVDKMIHIMKKYKQIICMEQKKQPMRSENMMVLVYVIGVLFIFRYA